jgi:hypothetical protein
LLARAHERPGAELALGKACVGTVRSIDACAVLASMLDETAEPSRAADIAHNGCNVFGAEDGERAARGAACARWGAALRDGRGTDRDVDHALHAFDDGCKLGDERSCEARDVEQVRRSATRSGGVADANLQIGSLTTNGVTVDNVTCKSSSGGGGLLGSVAVGKPFADKKRSLDACVKGKSHTTRVRWTSRNGRMAKVEVISGDDSSNRCIEHALTGARSAVAGTCAASIDLGH